MKLKITDLSPNPYRKIDRYTTSQHIARNFVARGVEVRKVRARRAKLILEVWGRIVPKYIRPYREAKKLKFEQIPCRQRAGRQKHIY